MLHQSPLLLVGAYIRLPVSGSSIVVDIGYDYGTGIPAMLDGRVVYAAPYGGYGNCIILEHAGGDHTLYAHCSALYASYGQYVSKGTVIAAVGSTGFSTGPHLHLEWWHNGQYVDPMGLW